MAGRPATRERLKAAEDEVARLTALLAQYVEEDRPKRVRIVSREYDADIIDDLIRWSDEGQFLDECFAQWGIDRDKWEEWCAAHVELRAAVGPTRARARAALLRQLREAIRNRTAFPVALADRIMAHMEKEAGAVDAKADGLVRIALCPRCVTADAQSAEEKVQAVELTTVRATQGGSHS